MVVVEGTESVGDEGGGKSDEKLTAEGMEI